MSHDVGCTTLVIRLVDAKMLITPTTENCRRTEFVASVVLNTAHRHNQHHHHLVKKPLSLFTPACDDTSNKSAMNVQSRIYCWFCTCKQLYSQQSINLSIYVCLSARSTAAADQKYIHYRRSITPCLAGQHTDSLASVLSGWHIVYLAPYCACVAQHIFPL